MENQFFRESTWITGDRGWHHDKHFQSAECPEILFNEISSHFSVCLALHDMDAMNGSLEVLPGSHVELPGYHRDSRPYFSKPAEDHFIDEIPKAYLDKRRSVKLKEGEFLIFHSALMHHSLPYKSGTPRISFVARFIDKRITIPEQIRSKLSLMEFTADSRY